MSKAAEQVKECANMKDVEDVEDDGVTMMASSSSIGAASSPIVGGATDTKGRKRKANVQAPESGRLIARHEAATIAHHKGWNFYTICADSAWIKGHYLLNSVAVHQDNVCSILRPLVSFSPHSNAS
jgi:hypothetical protein